MKKNKIPRTVSILGRKYKIKQGRGLSYNGQPCLGLCDNTEKIIYLEKDQDDEMKKETLLHELCHSMLFITGIDQKLSESENEMYAQLFTAWFHDVEKALK